MWNRIKRNKWKAIGAAAVGGVSYASYRLYNKYKNDINGLLLVLGPTIGKMLDSSPFDKVAKSDEEVYEQRIVDYFQTNQNLSDRAVQNSLEAARNGLFSVLDGGKLMAYLSENVASCEDRTQTFEELKFCLFSRVVSAVYLLGLMLCMFRIEVNIVSRNWLSSYDYDSLAKSLRRKFDRPEVLDFVFLSSTRWLSSPQSISVLVDAVQLSVMSVMDSVGLQDAITFDDLRHLFRQITERVDRILLDDNMLNDLLLPTHLRSVRLENDSPSKMESFGSVQLCLKTEDDTILGPADKIPSLNNDKTILEISDVQYALNLVESNIDEARNWLQTEEFKSAFFAFRDAAMSKILDSLGEKLFGDSVDSTSSKCQVGLCLGRLFTLSETILDSASDKNVNDFIKCFSKCSEVEMLANVVFSETRFYGYNRTGITTNTAINNDN